MSTLTRALLRCGAAAGPLFIGTFLVAGATRPDYDPRRHPVSSLALGPGGAVQTVNFLVTGSLLLAGAVGVGRARSRALGVLTGAAAASLVGAGLVVTDPVSGYPPGTPALRDEPTPTGLAHDLASIPFFLGLPAAAATAAVRYHREGRPVWAAFSALTAVEMVVGLVAASAGFAQNRRFVDTAGQWQRMAAGSGLTWTTAVAVDALRAGRD